MKLKIGHRLLNYREDRGLTQAELSDLLQIPPSTYARIERGETAVDFDRLSQFAELLKIPLIDLMPETMSIHNNKALGQGSVIIGTCYNNYYFSESEAVKTLKTENQELLERLAKIERSIGDKN